MASQYRRPGYRVPEPIGIGGVITTIALAKNKLKSKTEVDDFNSLGIHIDIVVEELMKKYWVSSERALSAIDLAKTCNVIKEDEEGKLYVLPRPKNY